MDFCSHGYCRHRGGDRTKETRACGEGVLCFNEGLTRWLHVLPALPRPTPARAQSFPVASFPLLLPARAGLVWGQNGVSKGRPNQIPRKSGIRPWRRVVMNDRRPFLRAVSPLSTELSRSKKPPARPRPTRRPPPGTAAPGRASRRRLSLWVCPAPALAEARRRSLSKPRNTGKSRLKTCFPSTSVVFTTHVV